MDPNAPADPPAPPRPRRLQAEQAQYEEAHATMDPNAVAAVLHAHPYCPDALLTMADLYRSTGESAYAGAEGQGHGRLGRRPAMPTGLELGLGHRP